MATASSEFSHNERLPSYLEQSSLAMLVLVPYIQDKLLKYSERWRQDDEDGKLGQVLNVEAVTHMHYFLI